MQPGKLELNLSHNPRNTTRWDRTQGPKRWEDINCPIRISQTGCTANEPEEDTKVATVHLQDTYTNTYT